MGTASAIERGPYLEPGTGTHELPQPVSAWTDAELVARMTTRDERAWREFFRRYERLLRSVIRKTCSHFSGVLGDADPDDAFGRLLHSLLSRDMARLRSFDATRGVRLSTWVSLLAKHAAYDVLRELTRHAKGRRALGFGSELDASSGPLTLLLAKEALSEVEQTVTTLSRKDQQFVELFYVEQRSPLQVASAMNITVKTVYTKKHKLQSRLHLAIAASPSKVLRRPRRVDPQGA